MPASAFTLSPTVEVITIPSVGATFQTVNFENTYGTAVPVCSYTLANASNPPATVRITSIGSGSMQVRIQQLENSAVVTPGTVSCLVAELGVNLLPDGRRLEARTVLSTATHGLSTPTNFTMHRLRPCKTCLGLFLGFQMRLPWGR